MRLWRRRCRASGRWNGGDFLSVRFAPSMPWRAYTKCYPVRGLMLNRTKTHVRREKPSKKSTNGRWCPFCANLRLKRHRFEGVFQCPLYFDLSDKKLLTCETVRLSVKPRHRPVRDNGKRYRIIHPWFYRLSTHCWVLQPDWANLFCVW